MPEPFLTQLAVADMLGISKTAVKNYVSVGELESIRRKKSATVPESAVATWQKYHELSTLWLNKDDYLKCLKFAVRSYDQNKGRQDFGGPRQRGVGKWAEDFIAGKLGEIAVERFFRKHFDIIVAPDFSIRESIPGQDVGEVVRKYGGRWVASPPRLKVNIKETKMKNVYLFVSRNEFKLKQRRSDVYILTRVDLPEDHLLRFLRDHPFLRPVRRLLPVLGRFRVQVAGFAWRRELRFFPKGIEGTSVESPQYALSTGMLRKTLNDWRRLATRL